MLMGEPVEQGGGSYGRAMPAFHIRQRSACVGEEGEQEGGVEAR